MFIVPHIIPHPALQSIVHHYFLLHLHFKDSVPNLKPMPAEPYQSIYFYPRDPIKKIIHSTGETSQNPSSILVGQQVERINLEFGKDHMVIQIAFQPGGLYRLFGIPMSQFFDISINSEEICGNIIKEINEKLTEISDYRLMIQTIEMFLLNRLKAINDTVRPIDKAMQAMLYNPGQSISFLADQACLSTRQFERNFYERIGVGPKMFSRVVRFNQVLADKRLQPKGDWLDIAYANGYFDFSHLSRDFKLFTGQTPTQLFSDEQKSSKDINENVVFLHT